MTTLTFAPWCDNRVPRHVPQDECLLVKVPTGFYDDHVQRDLTQGVEVKRTKTVLTVWIDRECARDLISDAEYYAGWEGEDYRYNRSVVDSARRTLKRLREQLPIGWAEEEEDWQADARRFGPAVRPMETYGGGA